MPQYKQYQFKNASKSNEMARNYKLQDYIQCRSNKLISAALICITLDWIDLWLRVVQNGLQHICV